MVKYCSNDLKTPSLALFRLRLFRKTQPLRPKGYLKTKKPNDQDVRFLYSRRRLH